MSTLSASRQLLLVVASRTSSGVAGVVVTVIVGRNISGGVTDEPEAVPRQARRREGADDERRDTAGVCFAMAPTVCAQSAVVA